MAVTTSLYAVLGVTPDSDQVVIEAAYRALMKKYHPDRFAGLGAEAERKAKALNAAYSILRDPRHRLLYDRLLRASREGEEAELFDHHICAPVAAKFFGEPSRAAPIANDNDPGMLRQGLKLFAAMLGVVAVATWLLLSESSASTPPAPTPTVALPETAAPKQEPSPEITNPAGDLIPAIFHGAWAFDAGKCRPEALERAGITPDRIDFWQSSGRVEGVAPLIEDQGYRVVLNMASEGRIWDAQFDLRLIEGGRALRITGANGFDNIYVRCRPRQVDDL
jgi:hypothetical protein